MTILVPFDGSTLAREALVRAATRYRAPGERVVALTVVPLGNAQYAVDRGWLDAGEGFDREAIESRLGAVVDGLAPMATHEVRAVDTYAPTGTVARAVRRAGRQLDASLVCVGSEEAGSVVSTLLSVGDSVLSDTTRDVLVVRTVRELPPEDAA
jgi:nucleotide-binding universal stress UspA family protein